jgi:hypothetical protein
MILLLDFIDIKLEYTAINNLKFRIHLKKKRKEMIIIFPFQQRNKRIRN